MREGFWLLGALLMLVPAGKAILYDPIDPDSFIHLLAADQMSREGIGPIVDSQSYMSIKTPWTPYSWLAEFGMKFIWDHGTYRAAVACQALMGVALIGLYLLATATRVGLVRPTQENPALASDPDTVFDSATPQGYFRACLASAFAAFLTLPYLSFRPVTLALVIMALIVWLLVRDRMAHEKTRAVWWTVPLTVLLINVHLYAIIVPAWLFALWTGAAWEVWRVHGPDKLDARRRLLRYTVLTLGTGLACLATPMLPGVIQSMVFYQFGDAMVAGPFVKEYQPFYAGDAGKISAGLVLLMVGLAAARWRQLRAGEIFWLLGSIVLLLRMGRFAPVFAMATAPIFVAVLPPLSDRVLGRAFVRLTVAAVLLLGIFRAATAFPGPGTTLDSWMNRHGPRALGYPSSAASYIEQNIPPRTGRMINDYSWGGYLSWRLGPSYKVLLDGRTNLYTPEFWRVAYFSNSDEFGTFLNSLDADIAIVPLDSRFHGALAGLGWTAPYFDERAIVLVPPGTVVPKATQVDE